MTEDELLEIEALCQSATPGPWKSWIEGRDHESGDHFISTAGDDIYLSGATLADQDFIARCREVVPLLIAEIRRLRACDGQ